VSKIHNETCRFVYTCTVQDCSHARKIAFTRVIRPAGEISRTISCENHRRDMQLEINKKK